LCRIDAESDEGLDNEGFAFDALQITLLMCAQPPPSNVSNTLDAGGGDAASTNVSNCTFIPGEGAGRTDIFVGEAESAAQCAVMVSQHHADANGATYSAKGTGLSCWAE